MPRQTASPAEQAKATFQAFAMIARNAERAGVDPGTVTNAALTFGFGRLRLDNPKADELTVTSEVVRQFCLHLNVGPAAVPEGTIVSALLQVLSIVLQGHWGAAQAAVWFREMADGLDEQAERDRATSH